LQLPFSARFFKKYEEIKDSATPGAKIKINAGTEKCKTGKVLDGDKVFTDLEKGL